MGKKIKYKQIFFIKIYFKSIAKNVFRFFLQSSKSIYLLVKYIFIHFFNKNENVWYLTYYLFFLYL